MSSWSDYLAFGLAALSGAALAWHLLRRLALARREMRWDRGLPP